MDQMDIVSNLDYRQAMSILKWLCEDENQRDIIIEKARFILKDIDEEAIAKEVFFSLNSLSVLELWDRSGETYYGYNDPEEEGYEMLKKAVEPYLKTMKTYRKIGMKSEERTYCQAIYKGVIRYRDEGSYEFRDWVPDDPDTLAFDLFDEWNNNNDEENQIAPID